MVCLIFFIFFRGRRYPNGMLDVKVIYAFEAEKYLGGDSIEVQ